MTPFLIPRNSFLKLDTKGYHNLYYTGWQQPGNPEFLNRLKNTYNGESAFTLEQDKQTVIAILLTDIPLIFSNNGFQSCTCVCVPRAKILNTYFASQMLFRDAVSQASQIMQGMNIFDGSNALIRHTNTRTTHFRKDDAERITTTGREKNDGDLPYPGITKATCHIDENAIYGKDVILIDDIYTSGVNIDEDCIQALYDKGARNVIFYAIALTKRE